MDKETVIEEVDWMRFDQFRELQYELGETKAKFFVELRSFVHDEDLEKLKEIINKYWDLINQKNFILVQDNSNAWYVIPSNKHGDWMSFLESDEIEQGSIPSYADRVGGHPCKVTFQNYRIKHVCCACCC